MAKGRKTGGRRPGSPNKITSDLRALILTALEGAGGADYLKAQAEANPVAFMTLLSRLLPVRTQYEGDTEIIITNPRSVSDWNA